MWFSYLQAWRATGVLSVANDPCPASHWRLCLSQHLKIQSPLRSLQDAADAGAYMFTSCLMAYRELMSILEPWPRCQWANSLFIVYALSAGIMGGWWAQYVYFLPRYKISTDIKWWSFNMSLEECHPCPKLSSCFGPRLFCVFHHVTQRDSIAILIILQGTSAPKADFPERNSWGEDGVEIYSSSMLKMLWGIRKVAEPPPLLLGLWRFIHIRVHPQPLIPQWFGGIQPIVLENSFSTEEAEYWK